MILLINKCLKVSHRIYFLLRVLFSQTNKFIIFNLIKICLKCNANYDNNFDKHIHFSYNKF